MKSFINTEENIIHLVFFWLKNPESSEDRKAFEISMNKLLSTSKYVKNQHFGVPAKISRPVVDNSYSYCLKVTFKDLDDHNNYQVEAAHKQFITEASHLWDKVLIYDSEIF